MTVSGGSLPAIAIDSSAIVAIMGNEPEMHDFNMLIAETRHCYISAANLLEVRMVLLSRWGENANLALDAYLLKSGIEVVDVSPEAGDLAFSAYRSCGKGRENSAGLNYGDCFAYALAKQKNIPLLFKGNDFSKTDISAAYQP